LELARLVAFFGPQRGIRDGFTMFHLPIEVPAKAFPLK